MFGLCFRLCDTIIMLANHSLSNVGATIGRPLHRAVLQNRRLAEKVSCLSRASNARPYTCNGND